jgi:hypothetical protein
MFREKCVFVFENKSVFKKLHSHIFHSDSHVFNQRGKNPLIFIEKVTKETSHSMDMSEKENTAP